MHLGQDVIRGEGEPSKVIFSKLRIHHRFSGHFQVFFRCWSILVKMQHWCLAENFRIGIYNGEMGKWFLTDFSATVGRILMIFSADSYQAFGTSAHACAQT